MLQRPQTLYLLGVFILSLFLFTGPIALFSIEGGETILKHSGVFDGVGERMDLATWPMTTLFVVITALAFLNIFFYRSRIRQMRICIFLILLNAGTMGMIFYYIAVAKNMLDDVPPLHRWRIVIPLILIILIYLAFRRIRRDELVVKAYDRIR